MKPKPKPRGWVPSVANDNRKANLAKCDETELCDDEECFSCSLMKFMGARD